MEVVLDARARHTSEDDRKALAQPWYGCIAGRMIAAERDVVELWQVIVNIRQYRAAYLAALCAPREHAGGMNLAVKSDATTEDAHVDYDVRSEEERHDDARRAWSELVNVMGEDAGYIAKVVGQDSYQPNRLAPVLRRVGRGMGWL